MELSPRRLAQAKRCQLIIGSWDGNPWACPCVAAGQCLFSPAERAELSTLPAVEHAQERCCADYRRRKDPPKEGA